MSQVSVTGMHVRMHAVPGPIAPDLDEAQGLLPSRITMQRG